MLIPTISFTPPGWEQASISTAVGPHNKDGGGAAAF